MAKTRIPFLVDNCVPASVNRLLAEAGHDVVSVREAGMGDAADPVIAVASCQSARVLVSTDRDFKALAKELRVTRKNSHKLHRIAFSCPDPKITARLEKALALIEWEWERGRRGAQRMEVQISDVSIRVMR